MTKLSTMHISILYAGLLYFTWAVYKGYNCFITTIMYQVSSYRTVVGQL